MAYSCILSLLEESEVLMWVQTLRAKKPLRRPFSSFVQSGYLDLGARIRIDTLT